GAEKDEVKRRKSTPTERNTDLLASPNLPGDDDALFARGGANMLTPLEMKEISNKAAHDILFEPEAESKVGGKISAARRPAKLEKLKRVVENPKTVKIEGLNHKVLCNVSLIVKNEY